jgi:hypothetical protein
MMKRGAERKPVPGSTENETSWKICVCGLVGYVKLTFSNVILPLALGSIFPAARIGKELS